MKVLIQKLLAFEEKDRVSVDEIFKLEVYQKLLAGGKQEKSQGE